MTVTLGADITALKRAMTASEPATWWHPRPAGCAGITSASLAGLGRGGAFAIQKSFAAAGSAFKVGIGGALAGGAAALAGGVKAINASADFEQRQVAFATLIGDAKKAEEILARLRELGAQTPGTGRRGTEAECIRRGRRIEIRTALAEEPE